MITAYMKQLISRAPTATAGIHYCSRCNSSGWYGGIPRWGMRFGCGKCSSWRGLLACPCSCGAFKRAPLFETCAHCGLGLCGPDDHPPYCGRCYPWVGVGVHP